jgi:hypothetical protein
MKAKASGAMARDLIDIKPLSEKFQIPSLMKEFRGRDRLHLQIHAEAPQELAIGQHLLGDGMHRHRASVPTGHGRRVPDMVEVAVGKQQQRDGSFPESVIRTLRGIHENVPPRALEQIGVCLQVPARERLRPTGCLMELHVMMFAFPFTLCNGSLQ